MIKIPIIELQQLNPLNLKQYDGFNLIEDMYINQVKSINNQIEAEIKKRVDALGIEFNADQFQFLQKDGDDFKHLVYMPTGKLIISIQKTPSMKFAYDGQDFVNNQVTCICDYKYY
jgi:hypothetical protein